MGVCRLRIGIFVASDGAFQTIAAPDPDVFVEEPVLNDAGVVAFYRSVIQDGNQVFELVAIGDSGAPDADRRHERDISSFGFRPPSLNNDGGVAFFATLDDGRAGSSSARIPSPTG
jgi:hypothetical protein